MAGAELFQSGQRKPMKSMATFMSCDWSFLGAHLHHQSPNANGDKSWLHIKSACSVFALLIWISSIPACLCTPAPAAPGCAVWYPACQPSSRGSHRSRRNGCASEAHPYYSMFWRCFCCLHWRAQGPRRCTELSVTPGLCGADGRIQTFKSTIKRQLCDCLC